MSQTYYDILEVSPNASQKVIEAAYRTLSQKYHPDKNNGDKSCEEMMAKINVAFGVLSDPIRRKLYDDELGLAKHNSNSNSNLTPEQPAPVEPIEVEVESKSSKDYVSYIFIGAFILILGFGGNYLMDYQANKEAEKYTEQDNIKKSNANYAWQYAEELLTGNGQSQNFQKALEEYTKIYDNKTFWDGRAGQRIAEIYFYGLGQDKDYSKAMEWFKKSKSIESEYMIGTMYFEGIGVKKDLITAYYYFNKIQGNIYVLQPDYQPNPLIKEQQNKFIDTVGYKGQIFGGTLGYGYKQFNVSASVKKQLLDKKLTANEINQAQNLKIND